MDFKAARRHMVESQVRTNDITDLRIQAVMEATPRDLFLPSELKHQAYVERDVAYAPGRRLLTARDFAKLLAAAEPNPFDLVLDVACGTGYSTAILAGLAEMVVAVEPDEALAAKAQENLINLGVGNAAVIVGDAMLGAESQGPFDLIFIGAAIEREPAALLAQVKDGARLAAIRRSRGVSRGVIYRKSGGAVAERVVFDASTSSILPGFEAPKAFVF
jgi:protein-L-isoaspartate(D-aspartate) O-methyltransferase